MLGGFHNNGCVTAVESTKFRDQSDSTAWLPGARKWTWNGHNPLQMRKSYKDISSWNLGQLKINLIILPLSPINQVIGKKI